MAIASANSLLERQQLSEVCQHFQDLPFKVEALGHGLSVLEIATRSMYSEGNISPDRRSEIEIALICDGIIPEEMLQPAKLLLDSILPKFFDTIDAARLFFWDTDWLVLSGRTPLSSGARKYDVIRKLPLRDGMRIRTCRRCGFRSEDVVPEVVKEQLAQTQFANKPCICFCAGTWIFE